jgi:hypothetical protein
MLRRVLLFGATTLACSGPRGDASVPWVMTAEGGQDDDDDDGSGDGDESWTSGQDSGQSPTLADDDHGERGDDSSSGGPPGEGPGEGPGSTGDGTAEGGGDDDGPPPPDCPENCYCEPIDPEANIDDIEQAFDGNNWADTYFGVLARRWPAGHDLLVEEQDDPYFGAFSDTSSFAGLMDSVMTEVHEGTHGWDYGNATVDDFSYFMRGDLKFYPPKVHGFNRSEIYGMIENGSTDLYAGTYLTGTQGTYGFYEVLDEGNAYINGMGGIAVVGEYIEWGISGRDGAVAFMYYLELYLRRARTEYPDLYADLQAEPEYVDLVRTQWLRMHFLLQYADMHPHIGIEDAAIRELMYAPANQAEIEMFIDHELDASNCLP